MDSDEDISSLLECSVCLDICSLPVQQCKNGHNICKSHIYDLLDAACPICRVPYSKGSVRNLLAEKLILKRQKKNGGVDSNSLAKVKAAAPTDRQRQEVPTNSTDRHRITSWIHGTNRPGNYSRETPTFTAQGSSASFVSASHCMYNSDGCVYLNSSTLLRNEHEQQCHFRPIKCCLATDRCFNAQIKYSEYINHLKTRHNAFSAPTNQYTRQYITKGQKLIRNGSSKLFILEAFEEQFLIQTTQENDSLYVWPSIHGPLNTRVDYYAKFKLVTSQQCDQTFSWNGPIKNSSRNEYPPAINRLRFSMKTSDVLANLNNKPKNPNIKFWSLNVTITISSTVEAEQSRVIGEIEDDDIESFRYLSVDSLSTNVETRHTFRGSLSGISSTRSLSVFNPSPPFPGRRAASRNASIGIGRSRGTNPTDSESPEIPAYSTDWHRIAFPQRIRRQNDFPGTSTRHLSEFARDFYTSVPRDETFGGESLRRRLDLSLACESDTDTSDSDDIKSYWSPRRRPPITESVFNPRPGTPIPTEDTAPVSSASPLRFNSIPRTISDNNSDSNTLRNSSSSYFPRNYLDRHYGVETPFANGVSSRSDCNPRNRTSYRIATAQPPPPREEENCIIL